MQWMQTHTGFGASYRQHKKKGRGYSHWHPGYAWAARRDAIDSVGGLIDWAILGSADHHMAIGLIGGLDDDYVTPTSRLSRSYYTQLKTWQDRAVSSLGRDIGYVPGTILHYWHGKKKDRRYGDRWQILERHAYCPLTDIKRDWQGLYKLSGNKNKMRDDIRDYFRSRNEDSIDLV